MEKIILSIIIIFILVSAILFVGVYMSKYFTYTNNSPLLFIRIPKTGSTTIENIGHKYGYEWSYREFFHNGYTCTPFHIPPLGRIRKFGVPIFTVIRNPYNRIISQYRYYTKNPTKEGLNEFIREHLENGWDNSQDCHWIPQTKYLTYVDHILKFENLEKDFDDLMKKYKLKIKFNGHDNISKGAKLVINDLSRESVDLINKNYKEDFIAGNYNMI